MHFENSSLVIVFLKHIQFYYNQYYNRNLACLFTHFICVWSLLVIYVTNCVIQMDGILYASYIHKS